MFAATVPVVVRLFARDGIGTAGYDEVGMVEVDAGVNHTDTDTPADRGAAAANEV